MLGYRPYGGGAGLGALAVVLTLLPSQRNNIRFLGVCGRTISRCVSVWP